MSRPGQRPFVADESRLRLPRARIVLAVAALVVLPAAVYLPMLLPGQAPSDFDAFTYLYPYHHALAQAWAKGVWFPLWNPSIYMGVPLLGNIQAAALYPPSLLFLLIPGPAAMGWSIVLALAIGGTGMFAYGTRNGLGYAGSPLAPEFTGICTAAAVLALATLALVVRWRKPPVAFWAAVSALAVWASTGTQGKLYTVLFHVVPGLDLFRVPSRLLLFSTVGAALVAGYGVRTAQQLAQKKKKSGSRPLAAPATVALLMAALIATAAITANVQTLPRLLRWLPQHAPPQDLQLTAHFAAITLAVVVAGRWLPGRRHAATATALGLALLVVAATDSALATANYGGRRTVPASLYEAQGAVESLVAPDRDHRYLSLVTVTNLGDFDRLVDARRPNLGMGDGRLTPDGYDGGLLPLAEFVRFRAGLLPPGTPNPPDLSLLHMTQTVADPSWLLHAGVSGVLVDRGLDPNPPTCPRCLVPAATQGDVTLWKLAAPIQPSRAWVEAGGRHVPAEVESDSGGQVVVAGGADRAGRLLLADTFYPGWTATVDGRPATIQNAYGMLRAVDLPPGRHRVVFTYAPRSFQVGLTISLLTLLLGLLSWPVAALVRRRRHPRPSPAS